jgi:phosphoribosylanthranilate isomerase
MSIMIKVKVCGMTDIGNVIEVTEAGADYLGFIFFSGSSRFVGVSPDESLFARIPENISKTGVFVNDDREKVMMLAGRYNLDAIQLHGDEPPEYCSALQKSGYKVIKSFGVSLDFDFSNLIPFMEVCDYFLFDTRLPGHGGSGMKFDWGKLTDYKMEKPYFLSGGIGPADIHLIKGIRHKSLYAVDINSRFEVSPGIKNSAAVSKFIKELKNIEA